MRRKRGDEENTIRDGGSTALYAADTVDMYYTIDVVYTVDMVYTISITYLLKVSKQGLS